LTQRNPRLATFNLNFARLHTVGNLKHAVGIFVHRSPASNFGAFSWYLLFAAVMDDKIALRYQAVNVFTAERKKRWLSVYFSYFISSWILRR